MSGHDLFLLLDKLEPRSLFFLLFILILVSWFTVAALIGTVGRVRRARWEAFSQMHGASAPAPGDSLFIKYAPDPEAPALPVRPTSKETS